VGKEKPNKKDVQRDDEELDRIDRGGRGGDNVSEMLGQWRDDIDSVDHPDNRK
jgi:hypothetical protein